MSFLHLFFQPFFAKRFIGVLVSKPLLFKLIFVFYNFTLLYKIAKVDEHQAQILMAVVKYKTSIVKPRHGLCSSWLQTVHDPNENIQLWINKGTITFPKDQSTPVIMVGPGIKFVVFFLSFIIN